LIRSLHVRIRRQNARGENDATINGWSPQPCLAVCHVCGACRRHWLLLRSSRFLDDQIGGLIASGAGGSG
jgi:hypothetical protein